jgi:TatD DNase family protein
LRVIYFINKTIVKKPIIVHSRNAEDDTYKILKESVPQDWQIHVHCFNDSATYAKKLLSEFPNLFIGFTGAITFNSAQETRDIIRDIVPLDRGTL